MKPVGVSSETVHAFRRSVAGGGGTAPRIASSHHPVKASKGTLEQGFISISGTSAALVVG